MNQMLYALCLSYHSYTEATLFECLSSGWATTTSRLLGNTFECLSQGHSDASEIDQLAWDQLGNTSQVRKYI